MSSLAEAISLWAREIIILLLLAGALEMILPETDIKRFARVALGFFVVLAVARPVLGAVGGGFLFDQDLAALGSWELGTAPAGWAGGTGSGTAGDELAQSSRDRALQAARAALETQIAALAKREPEVGDAAAEVDLVSDPSSPSYGNLQAVRLRVWLAPGAGSGEGAEGSGAGTGTTDEIVEPVVIEVSPVITVGGFPGSEAETGPGGGSAGTGQAGGTAAAPDAAGSGSSAGPLASISGEEAATGSSETARALATRLESQLVLLFGVPQGGITVEVWP